MSVCIDVCLCLLMFVCVHCHLCVCTVVCVCALSFVCVHCYVCVSVYVSGYLYCCMCVHMCKERITCHALLFGCRMD